MFDRVEVPTPFHVGAVNTYVGDGTVIDPGPNSEAAWEALVDALADRGQVPEDVEQVLITHPHPDHFGQAARLESEGATVSVHRDALDVCADFAGRFDFERSYFVPFFQQHGLSEEDAASVAELPRAFLEYVLSLEDPQPVTDGDTRPVGDAAVRVRAVEGHAVGEVLFEYGERAIVGDHVLENTTPNPFLQPPLEESADRPRVLPRYNASLETLADHGYDRLLPGHGPRIDTPTDRIRELLAFHEKRTANVRALVDEPVTAADVMHGLFDDLPVTEYFPAMSEAIGHLDVLEARGAVTARDRDGEIVYEPA
jgi:glyoxylase-like metal-dependent hydrolase (beta-lactamase superfamily II)